MNQTEKMNEKSNQIIELEIEGHEKEENVYVHARMPKAMWDVVRNIPKALLDNDIDSFRPSVLHKKLRVSFWHEHDQAIKQKRVISILNITKKICTRENFYRILGIPEYIAFIIRPFQEDEMEYRTLLKDSFTRIREMIEMPLNNYSNKGDFISSNAATILKAIEFLDTRVNGKPIQRIQQQNVNVNVGVNEPEVSATEIQKRLEEMKNKSQERLVNAIKDNQED